MNLTLAAAIVAAVVQANTVQVVPVTAEPRHHLVLENEHARVFDVVVPAGDATLFHRHPQDYVFVAIGDATLKSQVLGGPETDLLLKNGEVRFSKGPLVHRVINVGTKPFHNVTVQILSVGRAGAAGDQPQTPGSAVVLENDRVRIERIVLEPGQSIAAYTRTLPGLHVAVSAGTIVTAPPDQPPRTVALQAGDSAWQAPGPRPSIKNVGASPFEAIDISFK